jgi:hypothetical protein
VVGWYAPSREANVHLQLLKAKQWQGAAGGPLTDTAIDMGRAITIAVDTAPARSLGARKPAPIRGR